MVFQTYCLWCVPAQPRSFQLSLHGHGVWRTGLRGHHPEPQANRCPLTWWTREHQTVLVSGGTFTVFCSEFLTFRPEIKTLKSVKIQYIDVVSINIDVVPYGVRCDITRHHCNTPRFIMNIGKGNGKTRTLDNKLGDVQKVREKNPSIVGGKRTWNQRPSYLTTIPIIPRPTSLAVQAEIGWVPQRSRSVNLQMPHAGWWLNRMLGKEGKDLSLLMRNFEYWLVFMIALNLREVFATCLHDVRFEV